MTEVHWGLGWAGLGWAGGWQLGGVGQGSAGSSHWQIWSKLLPGPPNLISPALLCRLSLLPSRSSMGARVLHIMYSDLQTFVSTLHFGLRLDYLPRVGVITCTFVVSAHSGSRLRRAAHEGELVAADHTVLPWFCTKHSPSHDRPIGPHWPPRWCSSVDCEASSVCCLKSGHETSTMKHHVCGKKRVLLFLKIQDWPTQLTPSERDVLDISPFRTTALI